MDKEEFFLCKGIVLQIILKKQKHKTVFLVQRRHIYVK